MKKKRIVSRLAAAFLCVLLITALAACGEAPAPAEPSAAPTSEPTPEPTPASTPEPTTEPTPEPLDWHAMYRDFLSENYDVLADAMMDYIAGVGYIDLDLDGMPELVMFDGGASAAAGVELFDIVPAENGEEAYVTCVSASMLGVGEAFGNEYHTDVYVNCIDYSNFRLGETKNGSRFFFVQSSNGAMDFFYTELIRIDARDNGVMLPYSMMYRYESYDYETEVGEGESVPVEFTCQVDGESVSLEEYDRDFAEFSEDVADTGYEAAGVLRWTSVKSYGEDLTGLLDMLEDAFALYIPAQ